MNDVFSGFLFHLKQKIFRTSVGRHDCDEKDIQIRQLQKTQGKFSRDHLIEKCLVMKLRGGEGPESRWYRCTKQQAVPAGVGRCIGHAIICYLVLTD